MTIPVDKNEAVDISPAAVMCWTKDINTPPELAALLGALRLALTAAGNLQVGSFTLRASPDPEFVLIRHESGEGGSFKTANLEQALFKFFGEQF